MRIGEQQRNIGLVAEYPALLRPERHRFSPVVQLSATVIGFMGSSTDSPKRNRWSAIDYFDLLGRFKKLHA
jgi:hypothetical protein